ncbi:hypothetical protein GH714_032570 [Hevea brasiliensis]|uniref:non-specific serine/threonine protein kinase n=1 Tax=Hevea brasiliensis TaxID=3981 RepID=A0A6A6NC72_HEVBR|nr:hypothetical protein GH714_032570 [Hevea brasiliensis]
MWVSVDFADSVLRGSLILSLANESEISGDLAELFLWEYRTLAILGGAAGVVALVGWLSFLYGSAYLTRVFQELLRQGLLNHLKVRYLSPIQHRNLVTLLGYCQESNEQFLIYEYIPSGSVSSHLYGPGRASDGKLEFKLRLSIALGAAKGLAHLHSQSPRLLHKDFKTANVLVDENLLLRVKEFRRFSDKSDVFSFGVFLLELLHGQEATESPSPDSSQNLVEWVQNTEDYSVFASIVDQKLGTSFTAEGMEEFIQLIVRCLEPSSERRPAMSYVVMELDRILEKEMSLTTVMGEGTPTVTLGSQLFKASK